MQRQFILISFVFLFSACSAANSSDTFVPIATLPISKTKIVDSRSAFRDIFCQQVATIGDECGDWLPKHDQEPKTQLLQRSNRRRNLHIHFVPGIFGECIGRQVAIFGDATPQLVKSGYSVSISNVRGRASSEHNAKIIRNEILELAHLDQDLRVLLVGYSKGTPDSLISLVKYPEIRRNVVGFVSIAGAVNGTLLADFGYDVYQLTLGQLPFSACPKVDQGEVVSLTRTERLKWNAENELPDDIDYYSIVALPDVSRVSAVLFPSYEILSQIGARNDSQVAHFDAVLPKGHLLGYVNADHWAITLPFESQAPLLTEILVTKNHFPRMALIFSIIEFAEKSMRR